VWHSSLTAAQTKALELQCRAMSIIFQDNDYTMSGLDTLESQ